MNQEYSLLNDKKKYWASLGLLALLIGLTVYLLCKDYSLEQLIKSLSQANPLFLLSGLFIMFCYICCEALNTRRIMATFGQRLPLKQCLKYAFIGFYFCAITPSATGGQPAQIYYMKKDGIPVGFSALTLLINLAIYQTVTLLCGIVFFLLKSDFILAAMKGLGPLFLLGITIYLAALGLILAAIFSQTLIQKIFYAVIKLGTFCKIVKDPEQAREHADQQLAEYAQCVAHMKRHPQLLTYNFLITLLQLLCYFSIPYFVYMAFHLSGYSFWEIIAMQVVLTVSVSALPLPGAVGASEGSFLKLFEIFFAPAILLPAMLLTRFINFYAMLVISGIIAVAAHWRMTKTIGI
ncbi:MAG: flippase-like domain-containing protein [Peptococcaceae bacterium]|nr:flippase-like domain-containing protein [Peptococcaceae bacterium]